MDEQIIIRHIRIILCFFIICLFLSGLTAIPVVAGYLRALPLWWRLGDCSFGVIGSIVLWRCYQQVQKLGPVRTYSSTQFKYKLYEHV
jgi:hypothetical protein